MPEDKPLSRRSKKRVLQMQQNELTEYHIYTKVAGFVKKPGEQGDAAENSQ